MESSNPAKDPLAVATSPSCRRWLSTDDDLVSVTSDEKVAYLLKQIFACTKVQKKLLAEFPSCLCSTCKSHLDSMDMYRSLCNLSNVKVELFEEETDTIHLTAEHCNNDQQTDDVESVWIKSKVAAESAEEDYQSSQTVSDSQQMNSTYGYNRHDALFEAEEESLETLLEREPMDGVQGEGSMAGKTITLPGDPPSISDHYNVDITDAAEGATLNRMDPNGEAKSEHTGNQSDTGDEQRPIIGVTDFSVFTMQRLKVNRNVHKSKQKQQCPHCSATYPDITKLKIHIRTHTGEKPFMCKVCSKTFQAKLYLRNHMLIHNKDQNQCPQCPAQFATQGQLKDHIRTHTGEKPFICKVCNKTFHAARILYAHTKLHKGQALHQCPHCSHKFALQSQLEKHIRTHTGEKPFLCDVCCKTFTTAYYLKNHMKIHDKESVYQCDHCSASYANPNQLSTHIRTHTGEKPFMCEVCGKAFHAVTNLLNHKKVHDKDQYQCPHCPRKFARKYGLTDHILIHTGENPSMCKVCGKTFAALRYLYRHMQIHTGEKPYMCKVCSKTFPAASYLHGHMKIHNKDKNQCPHCSRQFARQRSLTEHIRTHTGEKPFMCKVCDKAFHAVSTLRIHMKSHDDDQNQCPHCPRKFATKYRLNNHIRIHTGEKPFICKVCMKAFRKLDALSRHMKIHTKDQHQTSTSDHQQNITNSKQQQPLSDQ